MTQAGRQRFQRFQRFQTTVNRIALTTALLDACETAWALAIRATIATDRGVVGVLTRASPNRTRRRLRRVSPDNSRTKCPRTIAAAPSTAIVPRSAPVAARTSASLCPRLIERAWRVCPATRNLAPSRVSPSQSVHPAAATGSASNQLPVINCQSLETTGNRRPCGNDQSLSDSPACPRVSSSCSLASSISASRTLACNSPIRSSLRRS